MEQLDLVIRGGTIATAADTFAADIGIRGNQVVAIEKGLPETKNQIDASGKFVLPGGVDTHAHIEQLSASGLMTADNFESATTAAAFGGTTTVLSFAAQHVGMDLAKVVADYHAAAKRGAVVDYGFHMIVADPTPAALEQIPALVEAGHTSLKVFMTYDRLKLDDEQMLDVLSAARDNGAFVCVHAENNGIIRWLTQRLLDRGHMHPKYHAKAHARTAEAEAINRLITLAEIVDQPIIVYHVSTIEGVAAIRNARARGLKVFGETCPHYLFLTEDDLDRPGMEGAKFACSPPPRTRADQEALWNALESGDLQVISSDHAPYAFDATGKLKHGPNANFKQIASGLPGIEIRMPLMFDAMVSKGRMGINAFVNLTSTQPAKLYGLHPRKGTIAVGADADVAIWDPTRETRISAKNLHDRTGYTPFEDVTVTGWPDVIVLGGRKLIFDGMCHGVPGSGTFLPRKAGAKRDLFDPRN